MDIIERMKLYETLFQGNRLMPRLPIFARLDGRCFHRFTKGMQRPYDLRMIYAMTNVTKYLVEQTNALVGYTQSDEITLAWHYPEPPSQMLFDGKVQKLTSVLASMASVVFLREVTNWGDEEYAAKLPHFDCRVWQVPSLDEAANVFLWRQQDATRNSISMTARAHYSHQKLHNKSGSEMLEMLQTKGVDWNDHPYFFKRGAFVFRDAVERFLTEEERKAIPEQHRPDPDTKVVRTELGVYDIDLRELELDCKIRTLFQRSDFLGEK